MSSFEDRKNKHESKFAHDSELEFKISARRNRLLGEWAGAKLGLSEDKIMDYAKEVVIADFQEPGDEDVIGKVKADFDQAGLHLDTLDIREELARLEVIAKEQITSQ